ncbi:MAG TPA: hypothetical protein VJ327_05300 [Patescibacteria group bacterium]|nr:hypothetical protein [Patescibacteria group bacterium]
MIDQIRKVDRQMGFHQGAANTFGIAASKEGVGGWPKVYFGNERRALGRDIKKEGGELGRLLNSQALRLRAMEAVMVWSAVAGLAIGMLK